MSNIPTLCPVPTTSTGSAPSSAVPASAPAAAARTRTDLAPHLPELRWALEQQRSFRLEQLTALDEDARTKQTAALAQVTRALRDSAQVALADIEAALWLMELGEYGRCQRCAAAISLGRLEVIPAAALCMHCQQRQELSET